LVRSIAYRLRRRVPHVEADELVSAGTIGLIEAVNRYDTRFGVRFSTFAYSRIEGAILDELSRLSKATAWQDGDPEVVSLQARTSEEHELTLADVTPDPFALEPNAYAELAEVLEAMHSLPTRAREMLRLSTTGHTVVEIARLYGCSEARASQVLLQARSQLEERTAV